MYYDPYAWASQHSLSEKNVDKPIFFFIHQDVAYSINIKNKKGV